MADYDDDLNLSGSPTEPPYGHDDGRGVSNRTAWIVTAIILLAIAAIVYFFIFRARREVVPPPGQSTTAPSQQQQAPQHVNPQDVGLPSLDDSDDVVRSLAHDLSSHPELASWLATDDLIRNFAVMIDNVADGKVPISRLRQFAPKDPLHANEQQNQIILDPASYARFNTFAEAMASLDTNGSAAAYDRLKPLIVVAYKDLGHPDGDVDAALQKGIINLLKAPVVEGPIFLNQPAVAYQFTDPQLAGLLPVQKQLIRMGPRNQRLIQGKLRELAVAIGIPKSSLPETPTVRP